MATVVPQQVVDPGSRLTVHVQVRAAEKICLDDHVMEVERAIPDAAPDLAVRAREAACVGDHAHLAGRLRRLDHVLGVGEAERHGDLDLDVLALRQRHDRLIVMLVARRRQDHRIDARTVDACLEVRGSERNLVLLGEGLRALVRACRNRDDLDVFNFCEGLDVDFPHRARTR